MKSSLRVLVVAACGLIALLPPLATAAPLYFARAETGAGSPTFQQFQSTEYVSATAGVLYFYSGGIGSMDATAAAGPGTLSAFADATINVPASTLGGNASVAAGTSRLVLSDIVISPLPGTTPEPTVPFSLSLILNGSLDTLASIGSPHLGGAEAHASVSVLGLLAGVSFGGDRTKISSANAADGSVTDLPITGTGILAGPSGVLVTPEAVATINSPFTLDLTLLAGASASYNYGGTTTASTNALAAAHSNFSNTLTLGSSNGQVFNLPAGYTANSIDGMIVNNRLVPEPSTAVLLILGILQCAFTVARQQCELVHP